MKAERVYKKSKNKIKEVYYYNRYYEKT
jgi:hypothetical protein